MIKNVLARCGRDLTKARSQASLHQIGRQLHVLPRSWSRDYILTHDQISRDRPGTAAKSRRNADRCLRAHFADYGGIAGR